MILAGLGKHWIRLHARMLCAGAIFLVKTGVVTR